MEKYDVKQHGDIARNGRFYFFENGTETYATSDYSEVATMRREMLTDCRMHHNAIRRQYDFGGYVCQAETRIWPYKGKFGTGYVEIRNYTTNWVVVTYWIRNSDAVTETGE